MMKKNNNDKYKLIIIWFGAFLIMIFIMIFAHKVEASDGEYFPILQNENGLISEANLTWIDTILDKDNNYIFVKYIDGSSSQIRCNYLIMPKSVGDCQIYGEISNNLQNFSLYRIGSGSYSVGMLTLKTNGTYTNTALATNLTVFQNMPSSKYSQLVCYASNFKIYTSNLEDADVVLKYGPDPNTPVDIGVAIIPPGAIVPDYPTGTTPPAQVPPTYTPTDYTWTTPPTFDSSSVTNAIGSIQNTLGWLANNLKEEFKNITDNGKHFVEYIGKTIQYYGNAILQTLNNFIQNFYDNMKSLVEPIYTKISEFADLFINPFNEEEFDEQIENCQLITEYNELLDNCEVIQQIFDETSEPDSFILYIDFENPFEDSEHKIIHGEINFNWLVPLRPFYRPFLQVFTLIECFVGGFRILGNIIGGKAK